MPSYKLGCKTQRTRRVSETRIHYANSTIFSTNGNIPISNLDVIQRQTISLTVPFKPRNTLNHSLERQSCPLGKAAVIQNNFWKSKECLPWVITGNKNLRNLPF